MIGDINEIGEEFTLQVTLKFSDIETVHSLIAPVYTD
jgi:hypothetical protein